MYGRRISIQSLLLGSVSAADIIIATADADGIGEFLRKFTFSSDTKYPRKYVTNAIGRLKSKGLIKFVSRGDRQFLTITEKGKKRFAEYQKASTVLDRPKKWDGKWRLVMFDIEESSRPLRNKVRRELTQAGFVRLQDSVWVYPYDCEEYVVLLKADHRIGKSLLYVVAERVEYDRSLKALFGIV